MIPIEVKPLAARADEFDEIVHQSLQELCDLAGRTVLRISEAVAEELERYDWPGNVRDSRNVLEFAVLASESQEITLSDLPPWFNGETNTCGSESTLVQLGDQFFGVAEFPLGMKLDEISMNHFEKTYLTTALKRFRGRINHTARQIGMKQRNAHSTT